MRLRISLTIRMKLPGRKPNRGQHPQIPAILQVRKEQGILMQVCPRMICWHCISRPLRDVKYPAGMQSNPQPPLTSIPVSWHPSQQHPSHNFPPHGWFPMSPDPTASQALHFPASRPLKRLLPLPRLGLAFFLKTNIEVISFPQSLIGILFHPKWLSRFTQLEFVHLTLPPKAGVCSV